MFLAFIRGSILKTRINEQDLSHSYFRCIGDDETFEVIEQSSRSYSFNFDAFRFIGEKTNNVYLTCDLYVCQAGHAHAKCTHPVCMNNTFIDTNVHNTFVIQDVKFKPCGNNIANPNKILIFKSFLDLEDLICN